MTNAKIIAAVNTHITENFTFNPNAIVECWFENGEFRVANCRTIGLTAADLLMAATDLKFYNTGAETAKLEA